MATPPKALTPEASPRHRFGAELRRWRELRGLSQRRVAELVLHSEETVGKVERAERWPTTGFTKRCDVPLGARDGGTCRNWRHLAWARESHTQGCACVPSIRTTTVKR